MTSTKTTWLHEARHLADELALTPAERRFAEDIADEVVDVDGLAETLVTTRDVRVTVT